MRDKLIELLLEVDSVCEVGECSECSAEGCYIHRAADHLIANGVTFAKDNNVTCKPMTNGDRIRSMTDEELAEFILDKRENGTCFNNKCYYYDPNKGCGDCTLEWLKQPVR